VPDTEQLPRFYLAAEHFGWGVRDRQKGKHPLFERVAYFTEREHGSWTGAQAAAQAYCDAQNEATDA